MKLAALEVAIAGAGIGGLSLATMLARRGARVVVYDQMAAPQPVGSGFVLQPTGSAVLARMDLIGDVRARGARITRMHGRLADGGKTVLDVRYRPGNGDIDAWRAAGRDAWIEDVCALWPEARHFPEIAEPAHARYRHHTRNPLADRRIVRIGDAWHATSPQLGQGANMALLDAASLCAVLDGAKAMEDALGMHLRQRQIHVRLYQALSLLLTPFYQSDSRILPLIRDLMTGPASKLPIVRDVITQFVTGELLDPVKRIPMD
ncbi:FAD-dependent oxidoreductase [Rhizobium binxianense]